MNLVSIKKTGDMKLDGIAIDAEWRDKSLAALTLTDGSGNVIRIATENYQCRAYVQAPPEKKSMHVVTATVPVLGAQIREEYEEAYEATSRRGALEDGGFTNVAVAVEEVDIPF